MAKTSRKPGLKSRFLAMALSKQLIVIMLLLLLAFSIVVTVVSVGAVRNSLIDRVDTQLEATFNRGRQGAGFGSGNQSPEPQPSQSPMPAPSQGETLDPELDRPWRDDRHDVAEMSLMLPGQPENALSVLVSEGQVVSAGILTSDGQVTDLDADQSATLLEMVEDEVIHTITIPGLGEYRFLAKQVFETETLIFALPLKDVNHTVMQLLIVAIGVCVLGLLIAVLLGRTLILAALKPLKRVTQTARQVSSLPGEKLGSELAPASASLAIGAGANNEVGQLSQSFQAMLTHVQDSFLIQEQSEAKVRQFVADASHELRTPVTSIRGYGELLGREAQVLPPKMQHAISRISSESVRMSELIDDLLLLARLDEGQELQLSEVDLSQIVIECVGDAHISGPDHIWELELCPEPVVIKGDRGRLIQVLVNLLNNARVHTPAGTRVLVELQSYEGGARLRVGDNGPGIEPSVRETIFERFVRGQASRSRSEKSGSSGLGLSIVKAIVVAHGGNVDLVSEPGATVFEVTLP